MSKRTISTSSTTAWTSSSSSNNPPPPAPPIDSWPIQLYRYIPSTGWELYQDSHSSSTVWSSIYATPKKNCVEIKKMRLRIHLFARPTETNDCSSSNNKDDTAATNSKVSNPATTVPSSYHATVVQRKDTLLITSSRGNIGAVVFKFQTLMDCLAFTNRLVSLNTMNYTTTSSPTTTTQQTHPLSVQLDPAVQTHLVQMIQDPNFVQLVQYMDTVMNLIPGGQDMLKSLLPSLNQK